MAGYISCNPLTGQVIHRQAFESLGHFQQKLCTLQKAQQTWQLQSAQSRASVLADFANGLKEGRQVLADWITQETGKKTTEAVCEIDKSLQLIDYYLSIAKRTLAAQNVTTEATKSQIQFEALGIVLAIMPWNYPVWQALRFAIPALLAGNACMIKPATSVALSTQALLDIAQKINLSVFEIAWLNNTNLEKAIAAIDAVAFTGSTATGQKIAAFAGSHLKKTVLELGGSNAFIVLSDADIQKAAKDACLSRFRDAGQSCNAAKRIIIVPEIAEAFVKAFLKEARQLICGVNLSPMSRYDLQKKLHGQVVDATKNGALLRLGGTLPKAPSFFYPATVLDNVNPNCRVYHEEVFGPVACILRATSEKNALAIANDTPFGLGASIYTANIKKAKQYAKTLKVGSVFVNRHTSSYIQLPFGGVKASGYGRELSKFGLYEFVNIKTYWQK